MNIIPLPNKASHNMSCYLYWTGLSDWSAIPAYRQRWHWPHDAVATLNRRQWLRFNVATTSCVLWVTTSLAYALVTFHKRGLPGLFPGCFWPCSTAGACGVLTWLVGDPGGVPPVPLRCPSGSRSGHLYNLQGIHSHWETNLSMFCQSIHQEINQTI